MITMALIVVSGGGVSPLTQLGGLSLVKRAVLTAQKAGATTCCLAADSAQEGLQHELRSDPRITSRVVWGQLDVAVMPAMEQQDFCLVFATDTIFRPSLVEELCRQAAPGRTVAVTDAAGVLVLALTAGSVVPRICAELAQGKSLPETTVLAGSEKVHPDSVRGHFV